MKYKNNIFSNTEELEKKLNLLILNLKLNGEKIDKSKFIRQAIEEKMNRLENVYERIAK